MDCDEDALVALVDAGRARLPHGRALVLSPRRRERRGARARRSTRRWPRSSAPWPLAPEERPEGSYTVELLDDPGLIGEKVLEEAEEVARAARDESDERVAEEAADVLYHLPCCFAPAGPLADVLGVLDERRG